MGKTTEKTYKSATLHPYLITDLHGVIQDKNTILKELEKDIKSMQHLVEWQLDNTDEKLFKDLEKRGEKPAAAGVYLSLKIPVKVKSELFEGRTGLSRYEKIFQGEVVSHLRSWAARIKAKNDDYAGYMSAGWRRTVNSSKPTVDPSMNLAFADEQYREWLNNDTLKLVINGKWYLLLFSIPKRHKTRQPAPPKIRLTNKGPILFDIPMGINYQNGELSDRYTLGVDVGVKYYATITVYDNLKQEVVYQSTLSERVHSLTNSINATSKQVTNLHKKSEVALKNNDYECYNKYRGEIVNQRKKNINKKRELAIIAAQEIASKAFEYNCVVVVEDLSWVGNTMSSGRWNRGALINWLTHFVTLNGSRVVRVNAAGTSQECSSCGGLTSYNSGKRLLKCRDKNCGLIIDRDLSASIVIARRGFKTVVKLVDSRSRGKFFTGMAPVKGHGGGSGRPLDYPGLSLS